MMLPLVRHLLALLLALTGCAGPSEPAPGAPQPLPVEAIQGTYRSAFRDLGAVIVLKPDHTFVEASRVNSFVMVERGTWQQEGDGWLVFHYASVLTPADVGSPVEPVPSRVRRGRLVGATLRFVVHGQWVQVPAERESSRCDEEAVNKLLQPLRVDEPAKDGLVVPSPDEAPDATSIGTE
jgi:hypothetical protein